MPCRRTKMWRNEGFAKGAVAVMQTHPGDSDPELAVKSRKPTDPDPIHRLVPSQTSNRSCARL